MSQRKRTRQRNAQYVQSILSRVEGNDQIGSTFLTSAEDMRKLKLGLQLESRKWRAEAAKLMGILSKELSYGVNSKVWGRSTSSGDTPVKALTTTLLSVESIPRAHQQCLG